LFNCHHLIVSFNDFYSNVELLLYKLDEQSKLADNCSCWVIVLKVKVLYASGVATSNQHLALLFAEATRFIFVEVDGDSFSWALVVQAWRSAYLSLGF
jgi:hypothetical protein